MMTELQRRIIAMVNRHRDEVAIRAMFMPEKRDKKKKAKRKLRRKNRRLRREAYNRTLSLALQAEAARIWGFCGPLEVGTFAEDVKK